MKLKQRGVLKCDACGKFVSLYSPLHRRLITPLSDFTREEWETLCNICHEKENQMALPTDPYDRKQYPIGTGVLDYFPDALALVAHCSKVGNDQHNPGEPLHWARGKSMDQADCLIRHFLERGTIDTDGVRHSAKMAWRALALLQLEIEDAQEGAL